MATPAPDSIRATKIAALRESLAHLDAAPQIDVEYEKRKAKVRHRALLLLDQRARSEHEITTRLLDADFEPPIVADVVADLKRCDLIDDATFAAEWVRQRHTHRGKSRRALEHELREKGISSAVSADALASISAESEESQATALAEKKARTITHAPANYSEYTKMLRKVVGVLARRGYGESMSYGVAKQALDQRISQL